MRDFKKRTLIRSILYSPLTASALLVFIFFIGHATIKMLQTYTKTRAEYTAALGEFEKLKQREDVIEQKIEALSSERGVEGEIRNRFGFIKEGEEVIILVEPPVSSEIKENSDNDRPRATNILESILSVFR